MSEWLLNSTLNETLQYPLRLEVQNDCANNVTLQTVDDQTTSGQWLFFALMLIKIAFVPMGVRNIRNCKVGAFRRIKIVNSVVLLYLMLSASFFFDGFLKLTGMSETGYPFPLYILLENVSIISFYTALAIGAQIWFDLLLMTKDRLGYSRQKLSRWVMISLAVVQSCCLFGAIYEFVDLCVNPLRVPVVGFYAVIVSTFSSGVLFAISCGLLWVYLHHYTKEPVIHKMRIMTTIVAVATGIRVIENITNAILGGKDIPSVQLLECKGNQGLYPYTAWWIVYMAVYFTITELLPTYYLLSQFSPASSHEAHQSVIYTSFSMTTHCHNQTIRDPLINTPAHTEDTDTRVNPNNECRSTLNSDNSR